MWYILHMIVQFCFKYTHDVKKNGKGRVEKIKVLEKSNLYHDDSRLYTNSAIKTITQYPKTPQKWYEV